jgi:hypothetical protein
VQVSELLSDYPKPVSRLLVFLSFSQPDLTLLLLKVVLMLLSETCMVMIGDGTSMIQSREVTGLEIKTLFNT